MKYPKVNPTKRPRHKMPKSQQPLPLSVSVYVMKYTMVYVYHSKRALCL